MSEIEARLKSLDLTFFERRPNGVIEAVSWDPDRYTVRMCRYTIDCKVAWTVAMYRLEGNHYLFGRIKAYMRNQSFIDWSTLKDSIHSSFTGGSEPLDPVMMETIDEMIASPLLDVKISGASIALDLLRDRSADDVFSHLPKFNESIVGFFDPAYTPVTVIAGIKLVRECYATTIPDGVRDVLQKITKRIYPTQLEWIWPYQALQNLDGRVQSPSGPVVCARPKQPLV